MIKKMTNAINGYKKVIAMHSSNGAISEFRMEEFVKSARRKATAEAKVISISAAYIPPDSETLYDPYQKQFRPVDECLFNRESIRSFLQNETNTVLIVDITSSPNKMAKEVFLLSIGWIARDIKDSNKLILITRSEDAVLLCNATPYIEIVEVASPSIDDIMMYINKMLPNMFSKGKLQKIARSLHGKFYSDLQGCKNDLITAASSENAFKEFMRDKHQDEYYQITFADVIGADDAKREIKKHLYKIENIDSLKAHEHRPEHGLGLMLYGPPGTAKTTLARAISGELDAPIFEFKPEMLYSEYHSVSERNIVNFFNSIKERAKHERVIVFADEFDSILRRRSSNVSEVGASIINVLLKEIAAVTSLQNVIFVIATNHPWDIDEAARRNYRIGVHIYIGLPGDKEREGLIRYKIKGEASIDTQRLVELTAGFSGADLFALYSEANLLRDMAGDKRMETKHFIEALKTVHATVDKLEAEKIAAWKINGK